MRTIDLSLGFSYSPRTGLAFKGKPIVDQVIFSTLGAKKAKEYRRHSSFRRVTLCIFLVFIVVLGVAGDTFGEEVLGITPAKGERMSVFEIMQRIWVWFLYRTFPLVPIVAIGTIAMFLSYR